MSQDTCQRCLRTSQGGPEGIRTLVAGLRSQSPRPLDDGALEFPKAITYGFRFTYVELSFAGVPGLEPRLTEPESAGLPITPYPKRRSLGYRRNHRAKAEEIRSKQALLPNNSIDSNSGGEIVLPVTAMRIEPNATRGFSPISSMSEDLRTASIVE
jgi:hypothetical protein